MKKYIEIEMEVLERLVEGKCVEGSLRRDEWTGKISFRAYKRQPCDRHRDRMIHKLEHGWVKESKERIKLFESLPKELGGGDRPRDEGGKGSSHRPRTGHAGVLLRDRVSF